MSRRTLIVAYVLLVGLPVLGVLLLVTGDFAAPPPRHSVAEPSSDPAAQTPPPGLLALVVEVLAILVAARIAGSVFRRIGQPSVVGEMVAGVVLGPSVLGILAPEFSAVVLPPAGLPYLNVLSQLGLIMFMFLVGLSLDPGELRHRGRAAILISHVSIALPVFLGVALSAQLYGFLSPPNVGFSGFGLFMGAAMGITAFPVLARILAERGMLRSPAGVLATTCAAVDDVTGWTLLAVVVTTVRGPNLSHPLWLTMLGPAIFALLMVTLVRPLLRYVFPPGEPPSDRTVASSMLLALACAAATEYLGVHLLFGAFLAGAIMPRRPELVDHIVQRVETVTNVVLLPLFFAYTGLRTQIGLVHGSDMWMWTALIVLTAIGGKLGGSIIAARVSGSRWREAGALGVLMNTRGLMELVALNIGLDVGVISPAVYSMMVIMALVTTIMTGPLLSLLYPGVSSLRLDSSPLAKPAVYSSN